MHESEQIHRSSHALVSSLSLRLKPPITLKRTIKPRDDYHDRRESFRPEVAVHTCYGLVLVKRPVFLRRDAVRVDLRRRWIGMHLGAAG